MVTGKDDRRLSFARGAVNNFIEQRDYYPIEYLHLIIINHNQTKVIGNTIHENISEHYVSKEGKTLGDLRNIAIGMVPKGAIWVTWDDDDIRMPGYLKAMYENMRASKACAAMITNRFEYNVRSCSAWQSRLESGFLWFMVEKCSETEHLLYDSVNTNEDKPIKDFLLKMSNNKCTWIQNDPSWYIRLIHSDNTSMYVDKHQTGPKEKYMRNERQYHEKPITPTERRFILKRIKRIYPKINRECNKSSNA